MSKKATIQNITNKTFNEQYKNWSYGVKLDNGDEGFLSSKKEFSGGEEIEYTIEELTSKAGKPYNKIKLAMQNGFGGRGFAPNKIANESLALSYSKDLMVAKIARGDDLSADKIAEGTLWLAGKFKKWLDDNKS